MATKSYYLTATTSAEGWRTIDEATQAAVTNADGWVVGTGATLHSEYQVGVERSTFTATTAPDGTLDTTLKDAFRSTNALNGSFAAGNWTFNFVVRAVTVAGTQNGRIRCRIIRANADGSSAVEITSGQQQASLTGALSATGSDFTSSLTFNPGAFSITNQYLFIQIAWERTAAGGMSTSDVNFRTGSSASVGTRIVTADFISAQAITTTGITRGLPLEIYAASTSNSQIYGMATGTAQQKQAQRVQAPVTFVCDRVALRLKQGTSVTDAVVASIFSDLAGTALATSDPYSGAAITTATAGEWVDFTLDAPVTLNGATVYYVTCERTGPRNTSNVCSWLRQTVSTGEIYADGAQYWFNDTDAWVVTSPAADLYLRLYESLLFAPTVSIVAGGDQAVTGGTIGSTALVHEPSVAAAPADQAVTTTAISAAAILLAPTITAGAVTITGVTLATSVQLRVPTVAPGAVAIVAATLTSTSALAAPTIVPQAVTITGATLAATASLSGPLVSSGGTIVLLPFLASTAQAFTPTIVTITAVAGVHIASTRQLFAPTISQGLAITAGTCPSTAVLTAPSVTVGATTLTGATLASTLQLFAPGLGSFVSIVGGTIATTASLGTPTLVALPPPDVPPETWTGAVVVQRHLAAGVAVQQALSLSVGVLTQTARSVRVTTLRPATVRVRQDARFTVQR